MGNHHEKLGLERIPGAAQCTIPDTQGTRHGPVGNYTDRRSSNPNQAYCTPHFSYPLRSSISFPSSSSITLSLPEYYHHRKNTKLSQPSLFFPAIINSQHRLQHTPSTGSTKDCLSSLHSHDYKLTPDCSFSFQRGALNDWPPSASSPWGLKGEVTLSHFHGCGLTNR